MSIDVGQDERAAALERALAAIDRHAREVAEGRVAPRIDQDDLQQRLAALDLEAGGEVAAVIDRFADLLTATTVHATHPRYFGLFNPSPLTAGIAADVLTAGFNPQLAAWSHAPGAVELEAHVIRHVGGWLGLSPAAGSFTSGGAEANATAVLLALQAAFPEWRDGGLAALAARPTLYASQDSHLAWLKIAQQCGLGRDAVRFVPVDAESRLDVAALERRLAQDRADGFAPALLVATAGTTATGAIDPLPELADLAAAQRLWLHVDAAWAGAAALSDRLRPWLAGIERADSVTVDAHKWFSVPMGAGMLLTPHDALLPRVFDVTTSYMPAPSASATPDPYTTSMQWSRRAAGLKLALALAVHGRAGYADQFERDVDIGARLRTALRAAGWELVNSTPLPLVCASDPDHPSDTSHHQAIVDRVVDSGRAWVSTVRVRDRPTVRACITNHRTSPEDVDALVASLNEARGRVRRTTTASVDELS